MATRGPEWGPMLDQVPEVTLVDPEPATIRHLQRIDRWTHALYTGWGGPGLWVPCHMDNSETPDDPQLAIPVPPGVEYFSVVALVSQRDKSTPTTASLTITSAATSAAVDISWQELTGGDEIEGAIAVAADDLLQVRSGTSWAWGTDTLTITFDTGTGTLWGLKLQPVHPPRTV